MSAISFVITPYGEHGLFAKIKGGDLIANALAANAAADALRTHASVLDSVAGVDSIAIRFHPSRLNPLQAAHMLEAALNDLSDLALTSGSAIEIPVCYGGACGPDFLPLCERLSLQPHQLINLHTSTLYRVLTIGFAPGFAYLGPLPEALQTERLASPRPRVPAGSVGVAGEMTGIYPLSSPGGWTLIGRTPTRLFDATLQNPFLFAAGATVRFLPIDEPEFSRLNRQPT
ncbi:5-oxoprolinase subunit PxpB [Hyphococcus sp.]|uniref:5-oxoprolinase subunit PxpB n=1 Tax=Hyphococcus sp. TaxID=2038636 RepID=UPI0020895EE4|nr:MAG: allophanate hydrolase [Marinicaulis sp.]